MRLSHTDFVQLMVGEGVMQFGHFTLKSGRHSPYFFNMGNIDNARAIRVLGQAYAQVIVEQKLKFDVLFGPAYKGIPLAISTALALDLEYDINVGVAFNRKEAKTHGEGGDIVGHALLGRVLILDDVITAGTAISEAAGFISRAGAELAGIVVALDRQEFLENGKTALQCMALEHGVSVHSISNLEHVIAYMEKTREDGEMLDKLKAHRAAYCSQKMG